MSTLAAPWINGNDEFIIETPQKNYMKVENGVITTNGQQQDSDPSVHFYIDRSLTNSSQEVFRFRPAVDPTKFVAVSGNQLVLASSSQITNNSNWFVVHAKDDDYEGYQTFSSTATAAMFITADKNGNVTTGGNSDQARFKPVTVNSSAVTSKAALVTSASEIDFEFTETITSKKVVETVIFNEKQVTFGIQEKNAVQESYVLQKIEEFEKILEKES